MAGDADEAHMCVLLFLLLYLCAWFSSDEGTDFSKGYGCSQSEAGEEEQRRSFLHSQRKICRRRKVAWVLERPQFWFEHMLLNQYAGSLTDLEGSLNGKLFIFAEKKTTPWSQKFSETHKNRTGVLYFRFQVRFDSFVR